MSGRCWDDVGTPRICTVAAISSGRHILPGDAGLPPRITGCAARGIRTTKNPAMLPRRGGMVRMDEA